MKRNGFTLVELLAVLAVLGIVATIIIPSVVGTLKKSEESAYKKQIHVLETAAEEWGLENIDELPDSSDSTLIINLNMLYNSGKITTLPIVNPITDEDLEGCILVTYNEKYKQHEYKYTSNIDKCNN